MLYSHMAVRRYICYMAWAKLAYLRLFLIKLSFVRDSFSITFKGRSARSRTHCLPLACLFYYLETLQPIQP